ncbi:Eco57I restriction-modification methylase domain-containing protein [Emticicia sp. SJ17W-69]|uniref:Eco57I restriction-modification methylase domain-containing protein n=1 Tax=Emticicia sp. SJ17W-69 TaxID=3421657 RepID=UPI003EB86592
MKNYINYFLVKEEQLIALKINKDFLSQTNEISPVSQDEVNLINANLLLTDDRNVAYKVHKQLINSLISLFINAKFSNYLEELKLIFYFENILSLENILEKNIDEIPDLIEELHITFLNSEFILGNGKLIRKKSKHHLKETGAVYTLKQVTNEIVDNTIKNAIQENTIVDTITCLDFACGTGRFYFEAFQILKDKYGLSLQNIVCNNLFAVDVDDTALNVLRCKIISKFQNLNTQIINTLSTNILNRNALIPKATFFDVNEKSIDLANDFNKVFENGGFDAVFSNPPYYLLKVNKKEDEQKLNGYYINLQSKIQNEISFFRTSGIYQYSIEGMLNYYQLSIEMIIRLTKPKGQIGIICPSSLFADLTSSKLRKHLLGSHKLHFIRYYSEASKLFENVSQSTVIFYLEKNSKTDKIGIEIADNTFEIDFTSIKSIFPSNFEIPLIDKIGWSILTKISKQKKIKEYSFIRNKRGELDLTLFKSFITTNNTGWRLVRGNMVSYNCVIDKNGEYVEIEGFLNKKSEDFRVHDYNKERLICPQISNVDLLKRLKFVFSEKTDILGNSCNYIVSSRKQSDLKKLYYILNSDLLNWRFKITSSNNHINNYELDELPIIDLDSISLSEFSDDEIKNNEIICYLYGLTKTETNYLLSTNKKSETI